VSPTRRTASGLWLAILGVLLLAAGAGILLASPRHRALYYGEPPVVAAPAAGPSQVVAAVGGGKVPYPDALGRLRVRIADREPTRLPAEGAPPGWTLKEFAGHASIELVRSDGRLAARLHSERASLAMHRDVVVELREFPYLSWTWR